MLPLPWLIAAALLLFAGCGTEPTGGPPEIQYGLEECGHCRMIISEEKFAAATVDQFGTATPFDDVGCLVDHLRELSAAPENLWVHDHADGGWITAGLAWFVRDPRGTTPMGSGLVAFAARSTAEAFASEQAAAVSTWEQVITTSPAE